ncbi:MAG: winged helix-turn-helix domain-containing protein [Dehalococcoidia bacterium]|nr:winged helix-turn-helix domain-containing protein [Dehalococcoidia bacterium]
MGDIPLDTLWQWWRELAKRELELELQYKPLVEEHGVIHGKRMALENLMAQGQAERVNQQISSEWDKLRKGEQLPYIERKPSDVAYDVLSRNGNPMHYRAILEEVRKEGTVIGGRDPGATLIAYLSRDERFLKAREVGRGYWKLKRREEKVE